eukprot:46135_1
MDSTSTIIVIIISILLVLILCCSAWVLKHKRANKDMRKQMEVIQKKLSALEEANVPTRNESTRNESPGSVASIRLDLPVSLNSEPGMQESMQEGMQQEGHTKHTKIESAVNLDTELKDDEKDNVLLDAMLSDAMKMPSLDPNQIPDVNDNDVVQKRNNESESENTDDMYDDEQNDEPVMVNECEENAMELERAVHLEVLPGDEYNNNDDEEDDEKDNVLLDAMLSDVMKMPILDPNQISEVNDNEIVQKRNNE